MYCRLPSSSPPQPYSWINWKSSQKNVPGPGLRRRQGKAAGFIGKAVILDSTEEFWRLIFNYIHSTLSTEISAPGVCLAFSSYSSSDLISNLLLLFSRFQQFWPSLLGPLHLLFTGIGTHCLDLPMTLILFVQVTAQMLLYKFPLLHNKLSQT